MAVFIVHPQQERCPRIADHGPDHAQVFRSLRRAILPRPFASASLPARLARRFDTLVGTVERLFECSRL